uniref:AIG1-type G domain-containing protein n=1 Tax=Amphimedon queenslandica TaxID=400682 RepID=A0A1X7TWC4_AMPQE
MTQEVKVVSKTVQIESGRNVWLELIDTPGLNEGATKDLSHMIDIIKRLNELEEIKACILVVKFNAKIDAQYKATMEYYSKLLPGLFEKNVIIVMTEFKTDDNSEDTILELRKCSKQISYSPQIFTIDCCLTSDSPEKETSLIMRKVILDYILQLPPIKVNNQMVAKTDYIKHKDAAKYEKLQGEIKGYKERLQEVHTESKKALDDTRSKKKEINEKESKIKDLEEKLKEKDTTEDVVAEHWSINEVWKWFQRFTRGFNIKSTHEITHYTTWSNEKCEFKEIVQTSHSVKGKVQGQFMRGIYASVTAYTEKRIKYADEIQKLKKEIETKNKNLTECKDEWEDYRKEHEEKLEEIELLEKYIAQRHVAAEKCLLDLMTMEDAVKRLEELKGLD